MKKSPLNKEIFSFITAFLSCWAIQITTGITVRNPLTVVLFVCIFACVRRVRSHHYVGNVSNRRMLFMEITPFVLSATLTYFIYPKASAEFSSSIFKGLTLLVLFLGYFCFFASILFVDLYFRNKEDFVKKPKEEDDSLRLPLNKENERRLFITISLICFICYLPYFLYEFPGIMTADSLVQYQQIIGKMPLSNHHPVIHTLTIKVLYLTGMAFTENPHVAIAFYTIFQMLFMSVCSGVATLEVMRIFGYISKKASIVLTVFFALMPFNAVFSVTIWKDVPFAGIAVLLSCQLIEMLRKEKEDLKWTDFAIFGGLGILFSLYRSNGWYAFVVFAPFFLYFFKEHIKEALITMIAAILCVILIKGPVFNMAGIKGPDFVESLSLPLAQVTRVIVEDRDIDDRDLAMIDEVIDRTYIKELYAPGYADNIKELVRAGRPEVIEDNKLSYLSLYLRLGRQNPLQYLAAFYDLEGGYFYPDVAYKVGDVDGIMANDDGLYSIPIIGGKFIKVKEILIKLSDFMPIYGMFFSIGAYTWLLVLCLVVSIRDKEHIAVQVLMLLLLGTLLIAAPVVDFRYAYAMVLTMPLWTALSFSKSIVVRGKNLNGRTDTGIH